MRSSQCALALATLTLLASAAVAQDNPEDVLRPSVVAIRNEECFGSGMFMDAAGLILTNAHVVCSPLPYRVHALAMVKGASKEVVFNKVSLLGFHPEYDLALIRIDPSECDATVTPVTIAPSPPAIRERVWAMGFPSDHDQGKTKVLSWGEVRDTNRDFFGDRYLDLDISVYHGNSGGPLSNNKGQVLGVITILEQEGALAIPIGAAKPESFGPLKNRAPNRTISSHLVREAEKLMDGAPAARSVERAVVLYVEALLWDPGNALLYTKVGQINLTYGRAAPAVAYFVRSLQLQPWPEKPELYRDLGTAFAGIKKYDEAIAAWREGLFKFPLDNAFLWGELGVTLEREKKFYEAACCARFALRTYSKNAGDMNGLYKRVEGKLNAGELSHLRDLESHIDDHLGRLRADSDRARRDGKAYMTPEAEKAIGAYEGVQKEEGDPGRRGLRTEQKPLVLSDDELSVRFIRGRIEVAKEHVRGGRPQLAIDILEDVVSSYPRHPETEGARLFLKLLRKP